MAKLPAIHFYPGDWLRDHIAGCSLAAQGLWLRMMILMHDAERYGYLSLNGSAIPSDAIARRCGCDSLDQYQSLLSELVAARVPEVSKDGVIYSRRMVRDDKKRRESVAYGKRGGNPTLNPAHKGKREGEDDKKIPPSAKGSLRGFNEFWAAYPKKKAKGQAEKAFLRLSDADKSLVIPAINAQKRSEAWRKDGGQFIPYPATWLNAKGWLDEETVAIKVLPENQIQKDVRRVLSDWSTMSTGEREVAIGFLKTLREDAITAYFTRSEQAKIKEILA